MSGSFNGNGNGDDTKLTGRYRSRFTSSRSAASHRLPEPTLRDISRVLFRHRGKMLLFFTLTMMAVVAYVAFSPKKYRSEARLFVRLGRENIGLDATTTLGKAPPVSIQITREEELNSIVQSIPVRSLLDKVVEDLGPDAILSPEEQTAATTGEPAPPSDGLERLPGLAIDTLRGWLQNLDIVAVVSDHERAVNQLEKEIGVDAIEKTNVVSVSHEGRNPDISQQIVAKLIDLYLGEHVRMNRTPGTHEFLEAQAVELKKELDGLENDFRDLKNSTGLISPGEQRGALVANISSLEKELQTTDASAAAAGAQIAALKERLAKLEATHVLSKASGFPNVAADGMLQQLYALRLREKELMARATDENVELQLVRNQLKEAQSVIDAEEPFRTQTTIGPNKTFEDLTIDRLRQESLHESFIAKSTAIRSQLEAAGKQLQKMNDDETNLVQLEREVQIRDANYRKYAESLEQARIDELLEHQRITNLHISQPPTLNHRPASPRPVAAVLVGLCVAIFGAVCLALTAEFLDQSLKTADEIEYRLNLPVLSSIPELKRRDVTLRR